MAEAANGRSVFVVHGRNGELRSAMFEFLRAIDLLPMEWTHAVELTGQGSPYIGQILDAAFEHARAIVVLLTPDEVAYLDSRYANGPDDPETEPSPQARPNVLFEAGMALGRNERRTILVEVGKIRPFSDVAGRHAIRLDGSAESRQALAQRLRTAGCAVSTSGTDWLGAGDFTAPQPPGAGLPLGRRVPSTTSARPSVAFDVKYFNKGGNRIDAIQIINRGAETAYDVAVEIPKDAALSLLDSGTIPKIPSGKSVTLDATNHGRMFGGGGRSFVFDVTVTGRTNAGDTVANEVFLDLKG